MAKVAVDEELEIKKHEYLNGLQMSKSEIQRLERDTVNSQIEYYQQFRGKHLISSYFGRICMLTPFACRNNLLKYCLSNFVTPDENSNRSTQLIGYKHKFTNNFIQSIHSYISVNYLFVNVFFLREGQKLKQTLM